MALGITAAPAFAIDDSDLVQLMEEVQGEEPSAEEEGETPGQKPEVLPDACITVPADAALFVGSKGKVHFVSFTQIEPVYKETDGDTTKYYFDLTDKNTYNYRVSGDEYVTYGGTFKKTADFDLTVTEEQLRPDGKTKTTVDRDPLSNNKYNVADIYLNINPQGYLKMAENDTYQLVTLRNWEAIDSVINNYFIEPDYRYEVIDENGEPSDIVEIDENGLMTAKTGGTAIVLVTYDAMTLNFGKDDDFYGAVYPENTGVFVVSVNAGESGIETGITINEGLNSSEIKLSGDALDSEHDCIYFTGEQGEYTFTPITEDLHVYAANPSVDEKTVYKGFEEVSANDDGSFSVPLKTGRNIVKAENDGKAEYQIITAKKVDITVNNGETVHPGDTLSIAFDRLYHPANKLAGVYNMTANAIYRNVTGYEGTIVGGASGQYNFASNAASQTVSLTLKERSTWGAISYVKDGELTVPEDFPYDTFSLKGGVIFVGGWGDAYGNHRGISYETGKAPNLNALARTGYLGKLPDINIPIEATTAPISEIVLNTENVKTDYYSGDRFDAANLTVTAKYEDGTEQIATNYSVSPETLTAETDKVTITYRGKTAEIPVTVTAPKVTSIEITAAPAKTTYTEGETFSPSGMKITAVYENGKRAETSEYSYSPNRELTADDTEMIISYTGEDAAETLAAAVQPITVNKDETGGSGSGSGSKITVYFTLLGDKKHGAPSGDSDTHTKAKGNLTEWIERTKITLDKGSYVIDAVEKALSLNGIPYTNEGNYISKIKGIGEFDNGNLSGWMYTLNGSYPTKGVEEQKLSNGDSVIFHYTDDYTKEKTKFSGGGSSSGSKKNRNTTAADDKAQQEQTKDENKEQQTSKPEFSEKTYADVKPADWHYEAVKYAYDNNLMQGTEKGFEPDAKMSRAMLVTVLWRIEKEPVVDYALNFSDVDNESWYTEAVRWAASEQIIFGIGDDLFGTNDDISREQLAAILYRYVQKKQLASAADGDSGIAGFADKDKISEYAASAIKWAVNAGIIKGKTDSALCPDDSATRAETAAMLMRFLSGISK